jgi:tetratricopeptide (TPR) repeat protein
MVGPMNRALSFVVTLLGLTSAAGVHAQQFGTSEAQACYQEALSPAKMTGTRVCTEAIRKGGLTVSDLAATYSNRGVIWARAGNIEQALEDHNKSLELVPDSIGALINRANAFSRDQQYHEAILDYDRAVELSNEKFAPALFNRGWVYRRIDDNKQALKDFKAASRLDPDNDRYARAVAETEREIEAAKKAAKERKRKEREEIRRRRRERAGSE